MIERLKKYEIVFFWICVCDLFFLPYFPIISTNFSLIIIALWTSINLKKIILKKENMIFLIMTIIMVISTIFSFFIYPKIINNINIQVYNIKVLIQFITYFLYFIFFKHIFENYKIDLKKIILCAFSFATIFAIIYLLDKNVFAHIKLIWNNTDFFSKTFLETPEIIQYRYNFIWSDPNNPAYFFVTLLIFVLSNCFNVSLYEKIFTFICTIIILITSMSTGGILSFIISIFIFICLKYIYKKNWLEFFKNNYKKFFIAFLVIIISYFCIKNTSIYKEAIYRISNNSLSYRFNIWSKILLNTDIYKYLFLGTGGTQVILNNGNMEMPHSGELYLIYSFGLIFLIIFLYLFFKKKQNKPWLNYIFVLPIFIGFTINTIVGEQKLVLLYFLIYTCYFYANNSKSSNEKKMTI